MGPSKEQCVWVSKSCFAHPDQRSLRALTATEKANEYGNGLKPGSCLKVDPGHTLPL